MIGALQGTIFRNQLNPIIVMTGGVGYAVYVPDKVLTGSRIGHAVTLYVHTIVRDDALELFGFQKNEELTLFELLLSVSGIGPRTSLLVVNRGVSDVDNAIRTADVDFFTSIPRLGKKNAQKIIIDLKSKLGSVIELDLNSESSGELRQVADALAGMGFARNEIASAVKQLTPKDNTIEQKIRHALQVLAKSTL